MINYKDKKEQYYKYSFPALTARNSIQYIVQNYNINEIYIPFYTCPVVWQSIKDVNCKIKFYHIDKNFLPVKDFNVDAFILYTNYFGINSKNVKLISSKYKNVIIDNAQAAYMAPNGIASFNSLRKFFNLDTGTILYTNKCLDNLYAEKCGDILLSDNEISTNKTIRLRNFSVFNKFLSSINNVETNLTEDDVPLYYPYLCLNEKTEKELNKNNIHVEKLWNLMDECSQEGIFSRYLLLFPLNKEYKSEEIQLIVNILNDNN